MKGVATYKHVGIQIFLSGYPPERIRREHFRESVTHTSCPWKGVASYYDVVIDGAANKDAAWYYP